MIAAMSSRIPAPACRRLALLAGVLGAASCAGGPPSPAAIDAAPTAPAAPVYTLDDILGENADVIDALLGQPALVRREGAGEFRRYALKTCSLIVILYPDETATGLASLKAPLAAHVEATALHAGDDKPDPAACLAQG